MSVQLGLQLVAGMMYGGRNWGEEVRIVVAGVGLLGVVERIVLLVMGKVDVGVVDSIVLGDGWFELVVVMKEEGHSAVELYP